MAQSQSTGPAGYPGLRRRSLRYLLPQGFFTLAWSEWGPVASSRPSVVCVHGLTRNGRDFDALAGALAARGRRVLCPDLPGRGGSEWLPEPALYAPPTYVTAISDLLAREPGPIDWVGTSLGGIVGLLVAAAAPGLLRRLVLNDVGALVPRAALARIADGLAQEPPVFPHLAALEAHLRRVHAPFGALTDAQWRHLAEISARPLPSGGLALHYDPAVAVSVRAQAHGDIDLGGLWARVAAPVLLLRGADSDLLLPETALAMAARPAVRLVELAGCGHAPALLDAMQVGLVAGWLDE